MPRDFEIYIEDILQAIAKIRDYVEGLTRQSFAQDNLRIDAVVRNLESLAKRQRWFQTQFALNTQTLSGRKFPVSATSSRTTTSKWIWISFGTSCRTSFPHSKKS